MDKLTVTYPHDWHYDLTMDRTVCIRCKAATFDPNADHEPCKTPNPKEPYYLRYDIGEHLVDEVFAQLPLAFRLYAHEGLFSADRHKSFYSAYEGVQIVIKVEKSARVWEDFLRTSPEELSRAIKETPSDKS